MVVVLAVQYAGGGTNGVNGGTNTGGGGFAGSISDGGNLRLRGEMIRQQVS